MSLIEFSFKGDKADLMAMLRGLEGRRPAAQAPATSPATMEPLHTDPVYGNMGAHGPASSLGPSNPQPEGYPAPAQQDFDFGSLPLEPAAWVAFLELIRLWRTNFDAPLNVDLPQPDRLAALKSVGQGRWPIHVLRWLAKYGSLQAAVFFALRELDGAEQTADATEVELDLADRIAANICQVAHATFPDIVGFHDYSTKWKRSLTP